MKPIVQAPISKFVRDKKALPIE